MYSCWKFSSGGAWRRCSGRKWLCGRAAGRGGGDGAHSVRAARARALRFASAAAPDAGRFWPGDGEGGEQGSAADGAAADVWAACTRRAWMALASVVSGWPASGAPITRPRSQVRIAAMRESRSCKRGEGGGVGVGDMAVEEETKRGRPAHLGRRGGHGLQAGRPASTACAKSLARWKNGPRRACPDRHHGPSQPLDDIHTCTQKEASEQNASTRPKRVIHMAVCDQPSAACAAAGSRDSAGDADASTTLSSRRACCKMCSSGPGRCGAPESGSAQATATSASARSRLSLLPASIPRRPRARGPWPLQLWMSMVRIR